MGQFHTATLRSIRRLVTHANCADGMASAILVKNALPSVEVQFVTHGSPEHRALKPELGMLFVDFTPFVDQSMNPTAAEVADRVQHFVEAGALVLDHHKQQRLVVEAFGGNGVFADELLHPGVAGATLALDHVWLPLLEEQRLTHHTWLPARSAIKDVLGARAQLACELARLAAIRDTWRKDDPDWIEASALSETLRFFPAAHWMGAAGAGGTLPLDWERMVGRVAVWAEHERMLRRAEDVAILQLGRTISESLTPGQGVRVALINTRRAEDLAEFLRARGEANILVGYQFVGADRLRLSLRADTTLDVGHMAKQLGGGGHSRAAGCEFDFTHVDWSDTPSRDGVYAGGAAYLHPVWKLIGGWVADGIQWPSPEDR